MAIIHFLQKNVHIFVLFYKRFIADQIYHLTTDVPWREDTCHLYPSHQKYTSKAQFFFELPQSNPVLVVFKSQSLGPRSHRGLESCSNNADSITTMSFITVTTSNVPIATCSICFKWPPEGHPRGQTPPPGIYGYLR